MDKAESREKERLKAEERKVCPYHLTSVPANLATPVVPIATQEGSVLQGHSEEL